MNSNFVICDVLDSINVVSEKGVMNWLKLAKGRIFVILTGVAERRENLIHKMEGLDYQLVDFEPSVKRFAKMSEDVKNRYNAVTRALCNDKTITISNDYHSNSKNILCETTAARHKRIGNCNIAVVVCRDIGEMDTRREQEIIASQICRTYPMKYQISDDVLAMYASFQ